MKILSIVACLAFCSCAANPVIVKKPDGTMIASLGWEVFEDSETAGAAITFADGTHMQYTKTGKSQTKVPNRLIDSRTMVGLAQEANVGEAIRVDGDVAKGAQAAGVEKAKIAGDVKVKTFVPPETVPVPAP